MARIEIDYAAYGERCEFSGATDEAAIASAQTVLRGMDWDGAENITLSPVLNSDEIVNQDGDVVGVVLEY